MKAGIALITLALFAAQDSSALDRTKPEQAMSKLGEYATVCGKVSSASYATGSKNKPTLLNLGPAYPNQIFTAVIWDGQRARFSYKPESLKGKNICVTGKVEVYRGITQIEPGTEKIIVITN